MITMGRNSSPGTSGCLVYQEDVGHMFAMEQFIEQIKIPLIVIGIIVLIAVLIFLYLLIAGADESRRKKNE